MAARPASAALIPPLGSDAAWASGWTPEEARLAVDQWKRGTFRWAGQLGNDVNSYPPIKAALDERGAVPCGLPWEVPQAARAPARLETEAAAALWRDHLARLIESTERDLALFGFTVWHHPTAVDPDTLRTEIPPFAFGTTDGAYVVGLGGVQRWPIAAIGYTAYPLGGVVGYYAIAQGGQRIQLPRPGETDGEWTVVGDGDQPHLFRAAIVALDVCFTAGMLAWRARSNLGMRAGEACRVGNLPEGVPVHTPDVDGKPVRGIGEDAADALAGLGVEASAALFPFGMKVEAVEITTRGAAEYFHADLLDTILLVALAVMGHGGALAKTDAQYRSEGGREVDVPEALTRRDVGAIERACGAIFAWLARANAGEDVETPRLDGHLPDADQAERRKAEDLETAAEGARLLQFHAAIHAERDNGFAFTGASGQKRIDALAKRFCVEAPLLPPEGLPPVLVKVPAPTVPITGEAAAPLPAPPGATPPAGAAAPAASPA